MDIVLLDGSPEAGDLGAALAAALSGEGRRVESFPLQRMGIGECRGCPNCGLSTPGFCLVDDDGPRIAEALGAADLIVYLVPLSAGPQLMPPTFAKLANELEDGPSYARAARHLVLGLLPAPDPAVEHAFRTLFSTPGRRRVAEVVYAGQDTAALTILLQQLSATLN
jgi:hypothetical protein